MTLKYKLLGKPQNLEEFLDMAKRGGQKILCAVSEYDSVYPYSRNNRCNRQYYNYK